MAYFNYQRRQSTIVNVGKIPMGGAYPIRLQSMTTKPTTDTEGCVAQCEAIIGAGADYVRLTTQGVKEAENLKAISKGLRQKGLFTPLIADVHFNPAVADVAAETVEGVRINPGNYVDAARTFRHLEYTDEEYQNELQKIEDRFIPFLRICQKNHTAIRIGVNHGSLSDRIMSRYGDTPKGIVESCMEFLRVCKKEYFRNVVISIKASDVAIMVQSVRLLVQTMEKESMRFPLHLGVTEAGEGEDGRIKSSLGIGALLSDGIGDTIRVSLSEEPENEIPVARKIVDYVSQRANQRAIGGRMAESFDYVSPQPRETKAVRNIGGMNVPVVISDSLNPKGELSPDYLYCGDKMPHQKKDFNGGYIVDAAAWTKEPNVYPAFTFQMLSQISVYDAEMKFLFLPCHLIDNAVEECLKNHPEVVVIAQSTHVNHVGEFRSLVHRMTNRGLTNPVVLFLSYRYSLKESEDLQIASSLDSGAVLFDGLCNGLYISCNDSSGEMSEIINRTAFSILQGVGLRRTRTEYISCPGCGRTLYDLQGTIAKIKACTQGLPNLKIAVMGCIVNGPGEMAGADYGYVGAGRERISLYRGKECVEKNIPEGEAVDHLLQLLRKDGKLK
ncbi:MAG TPA: 4-hydroxy-3-methylbut-2-en-1-yl diphosphate synthase [Prevotellaceae bacterium]|nr:4-hydroxy-3-methylbut-2-en-1-yl diphosphate synthase [Prevotellaceae bacterium]